MFSNLKKSQYIDPRYNVVKFTPEKSIKDIPYDSKLWEKVFDIPESSRKKMRLTTIGRYSAAKIHVMVIIKRELDFVLDKLYNETLEDQIITESNGGMGSITVFLAPFVKSITAIEIMPEHVTVIKNNTKYSGATNVKVINSDYMDVMFSLEQDIIICDPPWGGPNSAKYLRLGFNNVDIACIINELYKKNKFKIFMLVAPYNFDLQRFLRMISNLQFIVKKAGGLYMIVLLNL
jgi:hypothetical protein